MKIGLIYTSTTPELIELVEREVRMALGEGVELLSWQDPSILADIRAAGYVEAAPAARLVSLYMQAVSAGCQALLNLCSSVGEVADSVQSLARYLGVPIVRVDEAMCRQAVRSGARIAVVATLPTTMAPTKATLYRVAREMGKRVTLLECLVEGAFGLDQDAFRARMAQHIDAVAEEAEVILFAQGSMAYCEAYIADVYQKPVLSSPRFGAAALRRALEERGSL